jgi:phospholipase C
VHRFFEHQMQIDGGKNDGYAAWSDAGGLAMGHYDYSRSALYALAGNSCSPIISSRERSAALF